MFKSCVCASNSGEKKGISSISIKRSGKLYIWSNSPLVNSFSTEKQYEIRCPIMNFKRYLEDMKDLSIQIVDKVNNVVGEVKMNLSSRII